LPHHLQTTGVGWLVAAVVLVALSLVVFADGLVAVWWRSRWSTTRWSGGWPGWRYPVCSADAGLAASNSLDIFGLCQDSGMLYKGWDGSTPAALGRAVASDYDADGMVTSSSGTQAGCCS
jgi:hypothetical protein